MTFKTADLLDEHYDDGGIQVCQPILSDFGGNKRFYGPISTISCFEDNSRVREAVSEPGEGRVLVVDGAGSSACALLGDILAGKAVDNGWAGLVINGLIRDSADIGTMALGVRALGTIPLKSIKRGLGSRDIPVAFAGVRFTPENYLYADEDGMIVSDHALLDEQTRNG